MRATFPLYVFPFLLACVSEVDPSSTKPAGLYTPDGTFFEAPWPSDGRLTASGAPRWSDFDNVTGLALMDELIAMGEQRTGHSATAPIYLPLDGAINPLVLPTAEQSLLPYSPLQLINIDPRSAQFGTRTPLMTRFFDDEGTWLPGNLLALSPIHGFVLEPGTTYAAVATTALLQPSPDFHDALVSDAHLQPLLTALPFLGLGRDQLAVGTVFTTGYPTQEMARIASFLDDRVTPPALDDEPLDHVEDYTAYTVWRTDIMMPIFLEGEKPYATEGGAMRFREDGLPIIQDWEPVRISVTVPTDHTMPEDGWPVVAYFHGTGGNWRSHANSESDFEPAQYLAKSGVVTVGMDLPLHGTRQTPSTETDLHSFNIFNPDSALGVHRQGVAEMLYLIDGLTHQSLELDSDTGTVALDPTRVAVMGHSQGATLAAMAGPWMGDEIEAMVLSGGGGQLNITLVEREDGYDIPELARKLLAFAEDEPLESLHPVMGMLQSLVEPTDPIVYGPAWSARPNESSTVVPALMTSGIRDEQTPYRTSVALALAARIPFVGERFSSAEGHALAGLSDVPLFGGEPIEATVQSWTGQTLPSGLAQYERGGHFVIFNDPEARDLVHSYLVRALDGAPAIDPDVPTMDDVDP